MTSTIVTQKISPVDLIQKSLENGASVDDLSKLWDLQQQYQKVQAKKQFEIAITSFRSKCPLITKTKDGYGYKYAGLAETLEQIRSLLNENNFSVRWTTDQSANAISVTCTLTHVDGHSERCRLTGEPDTTGSKNSIQAIGSTVSYLQRYTLNALLGLASCDDTDGIVQQGISASQKTEIINLIKKTKTETQKLLNYAKVSSLDTLTSQKAADVISILKRKQ